MWKRYEFNGGTSDPCIISWPAGTKARGEIRDQYHHAIDLVPTILDALGVEPPETIKGHTQSPLDGVSMRESFDDGSIESTRKTQFYAMLGSRSIWHEGWKAVTTHPTIAGWGHFNDDEWELYHTDVDRSEVNNLAAEQPDKLRELVNVWFSEAGRNGAFPLDDRTPVEILTEPRPAADGAAQPVRVLPGHGAGQRVAGRQHEEPLLRDRRARRHSGSRGRGRPLRDRVSLRRPRALRQGQPPPLREQLRRRRGADDRRHRGHSRSAKNLILSASFEKEGMEPTCATGTLSLYHGETKVGEGKLKTQLGAFSIAGSGLSVGRQSGEAVTDDYPGELPYAFTGGTINRVVVDVSGEPYVDLERQAEMLIRSQ